MDGELRSPGTSIAGPPLETRSPGGAACANSGSWQVWQDRRPDADRVSSRNNCSPRAATGDRPDVDGTAAVATTCASPAQAVTPAVTVKMNPANTACRCKVTGS